MKKTIQHLCISCEGALRRPKDFIGVIQVDGRTLTTLREVKDFFKYQIALGHRVIPCGDCDNFDYETGCKGHVIDSKTEEK